LEPPAVKRTPGVGMGQQRAQPLPLEPAQFVRRQVLGSLELAQVAQLGQLPRTPERQRQEHVPYPPRLDLPGQPFPRSMPPPTPPRRGGGGRTPAPLPPLGGGVGGGGRPQSPDRRQSRCLRTPHRRPPGRARQRALDEQLVPQVVAQQTVQKPVRRRKGSRQ